MGTLLYYVALWIRASAELTDPPLADQLGAREVSPGAATSVNRDWGLGMPEGGLAQALVSPYALGGANEPVILYEGEMRVQVGEDELRGVGHVRYAWHPEPQLEFALETKSFGSGVYSGDVRLVLLEKNISVVGSFSIVKTTLDDEGSHRRFLGRLAPALLAYRSDVPTGAPVCSRVLFHIVNLPQVTALAPLGVIQDRSRTWMGRTVLEAGEWAFSLDQRHDWRSVNDGLRARGGHAITHLGAVSRRDGRPFPVSEGYAALEALSLYVSFLRGAWSSSILPVGLDSSGSVIFEGWTGVAIFNDGRLTSWGATSDRPESFDLGSSDIGFAGYLRLRNSPVWAGPLESAMRWCVETAAQSSGLRGSIILQATALELLGWTVFTQDPATKRHSTSSFDRMSQGTRVGLLAQWLGASKAVNKDLFPHLWEVAAREGLEADAPRLLGKVRNAFVHPKPSRAAFLGRLSPQAQLDAYRLGQTYLRESILKLTGYPPFVPDVRRV